MPLRPLVISLALLAALPAAAAQSKLAALQACLDNTSTALSNLLLTPSAPAAALCADAVNTLAPCLVDAAQLPSSSSSAAVEDFLMATQQNLLSEALRRCGSSHKVWDVFFPAQRLGNMGVPLMLVTEPADAGRQCSYTHWDPSYTTTTPSPGSNATALIYRLLVPSGAYNMCVVGDEIGWR